MDEEKQGGFEWWFGTPLALIVFVLGFPWVVLYLLNQGFLVGAIEKKGNFGEDTLTCQYLIGFDVVEFTHLTIDDPDCPFFQEIQ